MAAGGSREGVPEVSMSGMLPSVTRSGCGCGCRRGVCAHVSACADAKTACEVYVNGVGRCGTACFADWLPCLVPVPRQGRLTLLTLSKTLDLELPRW